MRSTSEKDREDLVTRSSTEKQNRKRECVTILSNREQVSIELNKYFLKNEDFLKSTENKPRHKTQR